MLKARPHFQRPGLAGLYDIMTRRMHSRFIGILLLETPIDFPPATQIMDRRRKALSSLPNVAAADNAPSS